MSCPLHKIGCPFTENISNVLSSPEWGVAMRDHPDEFREDAARLLREVQHIQHRLVAIPPGEITLSPHDEQALQAGSKELDYALRGMKNVKEVHDIGRRVITIIDKVLAQTR